MALLLLPASSPPLEEEGEGGEEEGQESWIRTDFLLPEEGGLAAARAKVAEEDEAKAKERAAKSEEATAAAATKSKSQRAAKKEEATAAAAAKIKTRGASKEQNESAIKTPGKSAKTKAEQQTPQKPTTSLLRSKALFQVEKTRSNVQARVPKKGGGHLNKGFRWGPTRPFLTLDAAQNAAKAWVAGECK